MHYKDIVCAATGILGSIVSVLFGGFNAAKATLIAFMAIDFLSGLACAGIFGKSTKTENGALERNL